jgi:hypothetical protein
MVKNNYRWQQRLLLLLNLNVVFVTLIQVSLFGGATGAVTLAGSGGSSGVILYNFNGSGFQQLQLITGLSANTPYSSSKR